MPKSKPPHTPSDWKVRHTRSAEADIDAILDFTAERDGIEQAAELLRLFRQGKPCLFALTRPLPARAGSAVAGREPLGIAAISLSLSAAEAVQPPASGFVRQACA